MKTFSILALLWAAPALGAAPEELQALFERANNAYLAERYEEAFGLYQKVVEAGLIHPDLTFNLANAAYRTGRLGLAVLYFEKTLALEPDDAAARANLEIVQKELIDRVVLPPSGAVGEPEWHAFVRGVRENPLTIACLVLEALVFGILIGRRLLREGALRRLLFWTNVPIISLALLLGSLLCARIYVDARVHHGVVVQKTAELREGPVRTAKVVMEIHEGLKVRLLRDVGDFVEVRLANGVEGYMARSQVGVI